MQSLVISFLRRFRDVSLRWRIGVLLGIVLLLIIINLAGVWWFLDAKSQDGKAINQAGEQRMLTVTMTWQAHQISMGDAEMKDELATSAIEFERTLETLTYGNETQGIPPPPEGAHQKLLVVQETWEPFRQRIDTILTEPIDSQASVEAITYLEQNHEILVQVNHDAVEAYEADFETKVTMLQHLIVGLFILDVIFLVTLFILTDRHVLHPIRQVAADAHDVASGNLDTSIGPIDSGDEIGSLAQSIRAMRTHLVGALDDARRFKHAIEHAGHAVYITDSDGTINYVNPAFEEITGYEASFAIGQTPSILKSGRQSRKYYERLWSTITAGDIWDEELVNRRATGELFHAQQTIAPITGQGERVVAFVAIMSDQTKRIMQSQQNQVFGRVLRHNLRTELNIIDGYFGEFRSSDSADRQKFVEEIRGSIEKLVEISDKADTSLRIPFSEKRELQAVGTSIKDAVNTIRARYPEATVELSGLDSEHVIPGAVDIVLEELLENAIVHNDQSNPLVTIEVSVSNELQPASLHIELVDNGPGIEESERKVIESGDESALYHGSGLGLWLVHWITTMAGGSVTLQSNEPTGTRVELVYPTRMAELASLEASTDDMRQS